MKDIVNRIDLIISETVSTAFVGAINNLTQGVVDLVNDEDDEEDSQEGTKSDLIGRCPKGYRFDSIKKICIPE